MTDEGKLQEYINDNSWKDKETHDELLTYSQFENWVLKDDALIDELKELYGEEQYG